MDDPGGQDRPKQFRSLSLPEWVLARVDVPRLILVGSHDVFLLSLRLATCAERLPAAVFDVVPEAEHLLPHERPDALEAALRRIFG